MDPVSLLELPKELLSQILDHLSQPELCRPARVSGLFNELCERRIYQNLSVIKYAYSHVGRTDYIAIRCFFDAIKKRPQRLSYIKEVNARLELRMDSGLHHACELFEALPKMPNLNDLCLEIVGGIKPHRENRALEQAMIWGCTFERGRMAVYKFFRMQPEGEEPRGLHALPKLRRLRVFFPSNSIGLQTDLMAYSALQHNSLTSLELKHIVNATLAPPKLSQPSDAITRLTMQGCQLPLIVYQSIFRSMRALQYLDYRPARPMGSLPPAGLVKALAHHTESLQTLSIKADAKEMMGLNLSAFTSLTHLQVHNPAWNEDTLEIAEVGVRGSVVMPEAYPPFLKTITFGDFHLCMFDELIQWMETLLAGHETAALPRLKEIRIEAEHLGDELTFDNYPMYVVSASALHINERVLDLGRMLHIELGVKLSVRDRLLLGQEAHTPGPYEMGPEAVASCLNWECRPQFDGSEDMVECAEVAISPKGATERLLLSNGSTLCRWPSWQGLSRQMNT